MKRNLEFTLPFKKSQNLFRRQGEGETERDRVRETEKHIQRETERQRNRQRETETERDGAEGCKRQKWAMIFLGH